MLGTNDLKNRFHLTAKDIAGQFVKYSEFLKLMQHKDYHKYTDTKVVLIAPPKIKEDWVPEDWGSEFTGTQAKSNSLKNEYVSIANQLGWGFIDTSRVKISNLDGIHLDDGGNKSIAKILETYFRDNIFTKDYVYSLDDWNSLKKEISDKKQFVEVRAGEIYWMHVGKNVGTEVDGKGEFFKRPVYVYKKLSKESFIGIPMTSKPKHGSWYKSVTFFNNRNNKNIGFCSLNQIKNFSVFRIVEKFGTVHYEERLKIKKSLGRLLGLF
jgi:mRNA-degrading endonuclease toxin of MazEF toxin-antitoxin module